MIRRRAKYLALLFIFYPKNCFIQEISIISQQKKQMIMKIEVEKEDILKISDTLFPIDGYTSFQLSSEDSTFGIKEIFIRNILTLFGESYHITSIEDYELDNDGYEVISLVIKTNLPWKEIENLTDIS